MCGIAGIISRKSIDETSLQRMSSALGHRGPDDRGLFISDDGHCALAHTRLSILDLSSAGHQPMGLGEIRNSKFEIRNEQRARYWITYNGEIYNYRQLREELGVRGEGEGAGSRELGISNFELRISDLKKPRAGSREWRAGHCRIADCGFRMSESSYSVEIPIGTRIPIRKSY